MRQIHTKGILWKPNAPHDVQRRMSHYHEQCWRERNILRWFVIDAMDHHEPLQAKILQQSMATHGHSLMGSMFSLRVLDPYFVCNLSLAYATSLLH